LNETTLNLQWGNWISWWNRRT